MVKKAGLILQLKFLVDIRSIVHTMMEYLSFKDRYEQWRKNVHCLNIFLKMDNGILVPFSIFIYPYLRSKGGSKINI